MKKAATKMSAENLTTHVTRDPWGKLRDVTAARIALGRSGASLPTAELLDFASAHAQARDAVYSEFNPQPLMELAGRLKLGVAHVDSAAGDRARYLQRPDLGRRLSAEGERILSAWANPESGCDLVLMVADGLSATAVNQHAAPLLEALVPRLQAERWTLGPLVLVEQGRVAIEDQIGELLTARMAVILIGERPGLGAADSLGAYLVYEPRVGRSDAERNCLSNIRPAGLPPVMAAETLHYLLTESRTRKLSGVQLKDDRQLAAPQASRTSALDATHVEQKES